MKSRFYIVGPDPKNSRAHIVYEKQGNQIVYVWRGFPVPNSTRMKLYPKGTHETAPIWDGKRRDPFIIGSAELYRERVESNSVERARIEAARATISAAVAPKKPTPPTPAPGGEYVQTTLFGYKNI